MQRAANGRFVSKKKTQVDSLIQAAKTAKGANKRLLERDAVASLLLENKPWPTKLWLQPTET